MGELMAQSAFGSELPLRVGAVELAEVELGVLSSLSPFGDASDFGASLEKAHGVGWPEVNRALGQEGLRVIWFGRGEVLLAGPVVDVALGETAAVVDVSDGWASVTLSGVGAVDVLARLVPIDLRCAQFAQGHTARTMLGHMNVSVTRIGVDQFLILVFRSMAQTLVHDLKRAMEAVASRG